MARSFSLLILQSLFAGIFLTAFSCENATSASTILLPPGEAKIDFPKAHLKVGDKTVKVEVAQDDVRRARGLMYRTSLPEDAGMLFIFNDETHLSFWMKNTRLPLSIGFFNREKILVDIQDMNPGYGRPDPLPSYTARAPALYALEMNQGWFQKNKIQVGIKMMGPEFIK